MSSLPDFETKNLAEVLESLTAEEIDQLPFGVVAVDPQGVVRVYSKAEGKLSGYGARPALGKIFFTDIAPCMDNSLFKGRIDKARAAGALSISFTFIGDFEDSNRELSIRVQSAKDGGTWIAIKRENSSS
jgi:photoactive yellow protein